MKPISSAAPQQIPLGLEVDAPAPNALQPNASDATSERPTKPRQLARSATSLVPDRFMRRLEVQRMTGLSRSSLYRLIAAHDFPAAINLSTHSVAWLESEVRTWVASRVAASRSSKA